MQVDSLPVKLVKAVYDGGDQQVAVTDHQVYSNVLVDGLVLVRQVAAHRVKHRAVGFGRSINLVHYQVLERQFRQAVGYASFYCYLHLRRLKRLYVILHVGELALLAKRAKNASESDTPMSLGDKLAQVHVNNPIR